MNYYDKYDTPQPEEMTNDNLDDYYTYDDEGNPTDYGWTERN